MFFRSWKSTLSCGPALAALICASGAYAQQAASEGVETVVVTAEKRSESTQKVAGQVTALTGSALSDMHANSFTDFAASVPGLSYQSSGPTSDLIAIRGVTTGGSQLSGAVGMYVDEVPIGASSSFGLAFQTFSINTFDLDRVEVLNGPQGTLYGSNALGGTIKYITAAPDLDGYAARAEAEVSSTDHGSYNDGLRVMTNIPLFDGQAAIRVDGLQQFDSGYADDPIHGRKNQGAARTLSGRASFLWQITPDLDVRLSAFSQTIHGAGYSVSFRDPVTGKPTLGPYDQDFMLSQPSAASLRLYSGVVNWNLHWATITSVTGYQFNHGNYLNDVSAVYNPLLAGIFGVQPYGLFVNTNTKKFTQEVRLTSPDNKVFEWLIGGYYTNEQTTEFVDLLDEATPAGTLAGFAPFWGLLPSYYNELAAFADGTYFITDNFDITGGIRYSENHQRYQQFAYGLFVVPTNPTLVTHEDSKSKQSVVTYLINPRYRFSDDFMVYAKAASGYRPGGPNFVLALGSGKPTFEPDALWNYEVGEKATFLDGKATLNFDLYDIEWSKIQLTVNNGGINQLENGGNARIQGAELSFAYRVLPQLTLSGAGAYTDAKLITPAPGLGITHSGVRLPLSPRVNFALSASYNFELGDGFSGNVMASDRYIGSRTSGYAISPISPLYKLPGYNTADIDFALFMPRGVEVDAYIKNVFDARGQVSASTLANEYDPSAPVPVQLSLPRTIGLVVKAAVQ